MVAMLGVNKSEMGNRWRGRGEMSRGAYLSLEQRIRDKGA